MAIYHLSIKIISRSKGKSAVAASAYRSGEKIKNEYDGVVHDFTRKGGIVHTEILLPQNAPQEFSDRGTLWNSVEKIKKSKNSQLAREIEIALPKELSREKQIELVREYVKENFVEVGMCADIALHDKNDGNPHAHILLPMRPLNEDKTWGAKSKKEYILDENGEKVKLKNGNFKTRKINTTDWNEQEKAEQWRKAWADITNKYLEENSIQEKMDHRSYQRRSIEQIPTIHLGVSATQMEKKGIATDRGNINREIRHQNKILREITRRIKALLNWIRGIGKEEKTENENIESALPPKENLLSIFENLIRKNADNHNADLEKYIESYQFLKEKNITSLSELKESIVTLRDKNYKTTRALKDTEKKINDRVQLIDQSEKYLKYKDIYKAYTKLKKNKQDNFYNEHTAEIILFESARKYLKEHLGESKTLNISKWKAEVTALKKEKKSLYNQILEIREEVEQAEKVKTCIEQLQEQEKRLSQVKQNELDL
ncbi:ATP-dependent exoDNAse (exonuclease V) subunit alpha [Streptococcus equi subsp. zooepidemicus Sz105]|uniref:MobQ family relaxase n=1 Tax=Streptococcus equi TaxID=1336 RepID=UPI0005B9D790|nr:MobQ family relaxase [Streptococcus equi]KIS13634.1 ATP-dependent exoDNAse (exonuclease V) subunit alpha [Streptococcus equi subsp. zooepidemicus Sz105]MDI5989181.1 MobQ family relaxase [Streptococcus equi subsp. zooepidemicus]HEL0559380.1 MobA/MobL family protein [Streptococcus equi subsp. zooepidemicus]HEL0585953.1 MobA/MobL family protein [Streptococcus equi subsp. zooepidemicus]HEL0608541.1 MobA/MobL family protein [Streptococcus equi subsp. zooepidemicus]